MNKMEMQTGFVIQCRNPRCKDKYKWVDCDESTQYDSISKARDRFNDLSVVNRKNGKEFRVVYRVETIMPL